MKFPSWSEFKDAVANFERYIYDEKAKVNQKIQGLKDDNPVFDEIIKRAIPFLPAPFNGIAQTIYSSFDGPKKDKVDEVLTFLRIIQSQTEEHYTDITSQLGNVIGKISDIQAIIDKNQGTLQLIKEILISKDNTINQKLDRLKNELDSISELYEKLEKDLYQSYGLSWLPPDYFEYHKSLDKDIENWKRGFAFELPAIKAGREFRRNRIITDIKDRLEKQGQLLIVGESGTSKSTILMEIMCDYFVDGYEVLYNYGETEIRNGNKLTEFIEGLLKSNNKVLVVADNVHDKELSSIFYVMDKLSSYVLTKNLRVFVTARLPEFDWFIKDRLNVVSPEIAKSIRKITDDPNFRHELPFFSKEEVKEFMDWCYSKYMQENKSNTKSEKLNSEDIYNDTKGHPIMVKFSVIGQGLAEDVKERYSRYLKDPNTKQVDSIKLQTTIICSLLEISRLTISDTLLKQTNLWKPSLALNHSILYHNLVDKSWKTLHPRWDMELFKFLYNESDEYLLDEREEILKNTIDCIFKLNDKKIATSVIQTMYDMAAYSDSGITNIPIDIVENLIGDRMPDYLDNEAKCELYALTIANDYIELKRYDDALHKCDKAIELDPKYAYGWGNKGFTLNKLGEYKEALRYFDKCIELRPNNTYAWNNKGNALDSLGKYEEAVECYDKTIELDPKYAYGWGNKGFALNNLGKYEEALRYFDKGIELRPNYPNAWNNKGNALRNLGKNEEAVECYDKTIELDPKYAYGWGNKGFALNNLGKYEEALRYFDKGIELDPEFQVAWLNKGIALGNLGRFLEAILCFDKAIELDPEFQDAWLNKGNVLSNLGRFQEAILCFDKAIELDPEFQDAWLNKGNALIHLGKYEEAVECFDKAIELDQNNAYAWNNKGAALIDLGKYEEAVECFDKAIELDPNDAYGWGNKGAALISLGKYEEALRYFDKGIELRPNYPNAWNNKGAALGNLGKYEEAVECFDKAIELDHKFRNAWNSKGIVLNNLEKFEEAMFCFDKAIELDPKFQDAWFNKGNALDNLGKYEEAVECFDKAILVDPNNVDALNAKAWIYANTGRNKEAILIVEKSLEIDPNNADTFDTKGFILYNLGNYGEAIKNYDKALVISSDNANILDRKSLAIRKLSNNK